jgi:hypothetical protein
MSARPQTTFAGATNPFTGQRVNAKGRTVKPQARLDLSQIAVSNRPLPTGRSVFAGKYNWLFASVKLGQCLECPSADVGKLANAAKKWAKKQTKPIIVRTARTLEGKPERGGVWLLAGEGKR